MSHLLNAFVLYFGDKDRWGNCVRIITIEPYVLLCVKLLDRALEHNDIYLVVHIISFCFIRDYDYGIKGVCLTNFYSYCDVGSCGRLTKHYIECERCGHTECTVCDAGSWENTVNLSWPYESYAFCSKCKKRLCTQCFRETQLVRVIKFSETKTQFCMRCKQNIYVHFSPRKSKRYIKKM